MEESSKSFVIPVIEASHNELFLLAYTDQATKCYNRNMLEVFRTQLDAEICQSLFVGIVNVNGLRHINDTEGYVAGDAHIKWVANRLTKRASLVFRLGGDEFLLLNRTPMILWDIRAVSSGMVEKMGHETLSDAMHKADMIMREMKRSRQERGKEQYYAYRSGNAETCSNSE